MTQAVFNEEAFFEKAKALYTPEDNEKIRSAYFFAQKAHANQFRRTQEAYFIHPCNVAYILMDMDMDAATVQAGLLHDVLEDTAYTHEDLSKLFGEIVGDLVDGVTRIDKLQHFNTKDQAQAENLRKLLLSMAKDIRVIIIKFADRLHNMRTLFAMPPEKQQSIAKETLEIYAPLAARLGIGQIKGELEDLSMRYLYPDEYYNLVNMVNAKKVERDKFVKEVTDILTKKLNGTGIPFEINGRSKHFYSIYRKMRRLNVGIEGIYDLQAIRIIVPNKWDCYNVLGMVHAMWPPLPGRFKDYIATPKPNNYQSLHTTVLFAHTHDSGEDKGVINEDLSLDKEKEGIPFEIQIRTKEMHMTAEYGIAAHWKYKDGRTDNTLDQKIKWLREVMELSEKEMPDSKEYMASLKMDIFNDEVFVFTPTSDIICLPFQSTAIDFAYIIHTNIGNHCVGAKVNNKMVPLNTTLKTGDIVEIITSNASKGPSRDWLRIVKTSSARSKIRQFFKKTQREENIRIGRDMLETESKRKGYSPKDILVDEWLLELAERHSFSTIEDLYAALGYGEISTNQIIPKLIFKRRAYLKANQPEEKKIEDIIKKPKNTYGGSNILINGESGMMVKLAKCCSPVPGDDIVGYISRGRGITVHRFDCPNINNSEEVRRIKAEWADVIAGKFTATLYIYADDNNGLMADLLNMISGQGINLISINAQSYKDGHATINISLELVSKEQLDMIIKKIRMFKHIISVSRQ